MRAIWTSAWSHLSDQMEGSGTPLYLFGKNKCVLWPLNPSSPLHSALPKTTWESESTNLCIKHVRPLAAHPRWSTATCRDRIALMRWMVLWLAVYAPSSFLPLEKQVVQNDWNIFPTVYFTLSLKACIFLHISLGARTPTGVPKGNLNNIFYRKKVIGGCSHLTPQLKTAEQLFFRPCTAHI